MYSHASDGYPHLYLVPMLVCLRGSIFKPIWDLSLVEPLLYKGFSACVRKPYVFPGTSAVGMALSYFV